MSVTPLQLTQMPSVLLDRPVKAAGNNTNKQTNKQTTKQMFSGVWRLAVSATPQQQTPTPCAREARRARAAGVSSRAVTVTPLQRTLTTSVLQDRPVRTAGQ